MLKELVLSADALWDAMEILRTKPTTKFWRKAYAKMKQFWQRNVQEITYKRQSCKFSESRRVEVLDNNVLAKIRLKFQAKNKEETIPQ